MKTLTATLSYLLICLLATDANAASGPSISDEPAAPIRTTFDCALAKASIEKLICRDPQLKQMDMEVFRLYRLALTDERSVPPPKKISIDQQFWVDARSQCGADPDPKACAIHRYAERAHQLRQGSTIARTKDPYRLTEGPVVFRCAGLSGVVAASFFMMQPGLVYLKWANGAVTLSQVTSDSGTRYTGKDAQGSYSFWQSDDAVVFQKPGVGGMRCSAQATD
ncbi:hypothetical protein CS078_07405 [Pseudomonas prosekii]|uniref:C-type lysozyme inhibitor domain-containing protein n=1 Tax=Pseudomonas prosekii TaxID=1148509 RepID=A0A3L8CTQ9_9PSED|nr:MliC family protein [Pseudomonas prosekii]RLU11249.1 hypothetical protein CS078_07405 [Pseudomonas prosekii]RLU14458.1 hypothetical protein CS076_01075 [Pseudomonas prosekii]